MKGIYLFLFVICLAKLSVAQQDVQFSHFKEYTQYYNPAYTGIASNLCSDLIYRNQWMGLSGGPKSFYFDVRYTHRKLHGGIGLSALNDELGFQKNTEVNLSYAYTYRFKVGKLHSGFSLGYKRASWGTGFIPPETMSDNSIPASGIADGVLSLSVGVYFNNSNLYLGLSSTNLSESEFKGTNSVFNFKNVRHYYVLAGYKHRLNPIWLIEPSFFAKSDAVSAQMDLSIKGYFNQKIYGALSYRIGDALCPQFGMSFYHGNTVITASYCYDATTSLIRKYSSGTSEIRLSACIKLIEIFPDRYVDPRDLGKL